MQQSFRDSANFSAEGVIDTIKVSSPVLVETNFSKPSPITEKLYSRPFSREAVPDWYFIAIILIITAFASARITFGKFLGSVWASAFSYQSACKIYKDRSIVQKRFDFTLNLLYLLSLSLFIYLLHDFFNLKITEAENIIFVFKVLFLLIGLFLLRIVVMRLTGFIFDRSELFREFLFHFFIYSKVLGMVLIPFLIAIPYTTGIVQEIIVYSAISAVIVIQFFRLFRVLIFVIKNVVLLYYLILYLCTLEILPVLVVIKLIVSLAQV